MDFTSETKRQIHHHLRYGNRVAAIKFLCDTYKISLEEASMLVDVAEKELEGNASGETFSADIQDAGLRSRIKELLEQGKKIEAVREVKNALGTNLREATVRVESIEREINPDFKPLAKSRGCVRVVAFFVAAVSFLLLAAAFYAYQHQAQTIETGVKVVGVVTDMEYSDGAGAPVVTYPWNGEDRIYRSDTYTNPPAFEVGEEVILYVDETDTDRVLIDSFSERWLGVLILGLLGMVFGLVALAIILVNRRF